MIPFSDEEIEWLKREITACKCLIPVSDLEKGYNQGMDKALRFIRDYEEGRDLIQLVPYSKINL